MARRSYRCRRCLLALSRWALGLSLACIAHPTLALTTRRRNCERTESEHSDGAFRRDGALSLRHPFPQACDVAVHPLGCLYLRRVALRLRILAHCEPELADTFQIFSVHPQCHHHDSRTHHQQPYDAWGGRCIQIRREIQSLALARGHDGPRRT